VALLALYSWTKLNRALPRTIIRIIRASTQSPSAADMAVAKSRMMMIELLNWPRKSSQAAAFRLVSNTLGPYSLSRWPASAVLRPREVLCSEARRLSAGSLQYFS
jgi:hypothetical protein